MAEQKKFNPNYGVYCCSHVFNKTRDVLVVVRDDGWQFLCGEEDDGDECHLIGVGHLVERDPSLECMAELDNMTGASRIHINAEWEPFDLED